jgi:hypothetical protein
MKRIVLIVCVFLANYILSATTGMQNFVFVFFTDSWIQSKILREDNRVMSIIIKIAEPLEKGI